MKVTTTSTSTATLAVPYTCRCAFCGATIQGEEKITVEGHAFAGGYATGAQGEIMKLAALPWNADDLPRFDEDFLAQAKAQYEQSRQEPTATRWCSRLTAICMIRPDTAVRRG